ncbi:MAG: extracellular solute-binding protein [Oscillospiraceae bacterium]|nr:extracellular solute-binding protein [Oscillospiraceae bacterium]
MRKFLALILILTMVFVCLAFTASCGEKNNDEGENINNNNNGNKNDPDNPETVPDEETAAAKIEPDIPDANYGGHQFNILLSINGEFSNAGGGMWNDFEAEVETGDSINDAIYKRNVYIEDKYNIKIKVIEAQAADNMERPAAQKMLKNSVQANDNAYDAALLSGYATCQLASGGFLMDMNSMAPLDLSKPWWDQKANRDLMIKNKMFYTAGDISNVTNYATYAMLFNKQLVQEYGLEDPYALVRNGEWTYPKMIEMAVQVSGDLNGDGKYDFDDLYGALVWDDTMMGIVNSIGEKCAVVNKDGGIELALNSERVLGVFNLYTDYVYDKTKALTYQRQDWDGSKSTTMFSNDQALFWIQIMELVVRLRAQEINFGVLPYPKLDASQENYYSTVGSWHSGFICVPISQEDSVRTATILEALAAESKYTIRPAYYDIALKGKYVRDEESEEMLDLIFDSKIYDLGWLYQIGGYNERIMDLLRSFKGDFISMYEKNLSKAEKDIEKINAAFDEILN